MWSVCVNPSIRMALLVDCFRPRVALSLRDELMLSSWEKWQRYKRFPWRMVVDVALLAVVVALTVVVAAQTAQFSNGTEITFSKLFGRGGSHVFDADDFMTHFRLLTSDFWNVSTISLARFSHVLTDGMVREPILTLRQWGNGLGQFNNHSIYSEPSAWNVLTTIYRLSEENPVGPFNQSSRENLTLLQSMIDVTISLQIISLNVGPLGGIPFLWRLTAVYSFSGSGIAVFNLITEKILQPRDSPYVGLIVFNVFGLLIALVSAGLSVRALFSGVLLIRRLASALSALPPGKLASVTGCASYQELPWSVKISPLPIWQMWNFVACCFTAVGCGLGAAYYSFVIESPGAMAYNLFLGLATFFLCCNIVKYFEFSRKMSVLVNTLRLSFGRIGAFLLSVFPIFIGFVLLGVAMFSQYTTRFASVSEAAVSLISLLFGDDVHLTFNEMTDELPPNWIWFGHVFLYCWLFLAICAILNVAIFLIEDAFLTARQQNQRVEKSIDISLESLVSVLDAAEHHGSEEDGPLLAGSYQPVGHASMNSSMASDREHLLRQLDLKRKEMDDILNQLLSIT